MKPSENISQNTVGERKKEMKSTSFSFKSYYCEQDNRRNLQYHKYRYYQPSQSNAQQQQQQNRLQKNVDHDQYQTITNKKDMVIVNTNQLQILINKQLMITRNNKNKTQNQSTTECKLLRQRKIMNSSSFNNSKNKNSIYQNNEKNYQSPFIMWRKRHTIKQQKQHQPSLLSTQLKDQLNNNNNNNKLQQIHQSLTALKTKQQCFSPKRSYDYFINKLNKSTTNPQAKEQLIKELKLSKLGDKILLDRQNKSFSVCHKGKGMMAGSYNKAGLLRLESGLVYSGDGIKDEGQHQYLINYSKQPFFDNNVAPCKISPLKLPIRTHPYEKYEKRISHNPSFHLQHIRRPRVYVKERQEQYSREAKSPYHNELSAWS